VWFLTSEDVVKEIKWQKSTHDEIDGIKKNNTQELSELPKEWKIIGVKWIFKTRLKENPSLLNQVFKNINYC